MIDEVCPDRIEEIQKFIKGGEATEEFFAHLETCVWCAVEVDVAFNEQARNFEELIRILRVAGKSE